MWEACALNTNLPPPQCRYGNITYMFDHWANPVVHLLLLKSSKAGVFWVKKCTNITKVD